MPVAHDPEVPAVGLLITRLTAPRQDDCADPMSLRSDRTIEPDQAVTLASPLPILFAAFPALTLGRANMAFTLIRTRATEQLLDTAAHVLLAFRAKVAPAAREPEAIARRMALTTLAEPVFSVARMLLAIRLESSPANVAAALSDRLARRTVWAEHLLVADANALPVFRASAAPEAILPATALAATRLSFAPREALVDPTVRLIVVARAALWGIVSAASTFPARLAPVAVKLADDAVNALVRWLP